MKFTFIYIYFILSIALILFLLVSCKEATPHDQISLETVELGGEVPMIRTRQTGEDFRGYWYQGKAEVNSYELSQARYGELREGEAALIFVTEPFLPIKQVKADRPGEEGIPVLKLNASKKFLTGIYPYSIMESTFSPIRTTDRPIKNTLSVQEWCGQVYVQLNNREGFELESHSYFESEADQSFRLPEHYLESEVWNLIRIDPSELPLGEFKMIPSFEYSRLYHREIKAYQASGKIAKEGSNSMYSLHYPELGRTLSITFETDFPHGIQAWEETRSDGYRSDAREWSTKAKLKKRLLIPYWQLNANKDLVYRDSLELSR